MSGRTLRRLFNEIHQTIHYYSIYIPGRRNHTSAGSPSGPCKHLWSACHADRVKKELDSWGVLRPILVPFLVITLLSTIIVMIITGKVTQLFIKNGRNGKAEKNE